MDERYRAYNELTFESYCKNYIKRIVQNARRKKNRRASLETPFSSLPDAALREVYAVPAIQGKGEIEGIRFRLLGLTVVVHDLKLGQALLHLTPKRRAIILMAYFMDMSDTEIAQKLHISKSAVQRHRAGATEHLRILLEM